MASLIDLNLAAGTAVRCLTSIWRCEAMGRRVRATLRAYFDKRIAIAQFARGVPPTFRSVPAPPEESR